MRARWPDRRPLNEHLGFEEASAASGGGSPPPVSSWPEARRACGGADHPTE
jgi:hypothetical protein